MSVETQIAPDMAVSELHDGPPKLSARERSQLIIDAARQEGRIPKDMGGLACGSCLYAPICIAGGEPNCDSSDGQVKDGVETTPSVDKNLLFEELSDNDDKLNTASTVPFTRSKTEISLSRRNQTKSEKTVKAEPVPTIVAVVERAEPVKLVSDEELNIVKADAVAVAVVETPTIPVVVEVVSPATPAVNKYLQPHDSEKPKQNVTPTGLADETSASKFGDIKTNQPKTREVRVDSPKPLVKEVREKPVAQVVEKLVTTPAKSVARESTPRAVKSESARPVASEAKTRCVESKNPRPEPSFKSEALNNKADKTAVVVSTSEFQSPETAPKAQKPVESRGEYSKTEIRPKFASETEPTTPTGSIEADEQSAARPVVVKENLPDIKIDISSFEIKPVSNINESTPATETVTSEDTVTATSPAEVGSETYPDSMLVVQKEPGPYLDMSADARNLKTEVYVDIPRDTNEVSNPQVIEDTPVPSAYVTEEIVPDSLLDGRDLGAGIVQHDNNEAEELFIDSVADDEPVNTELKATDSTSEYELEVDMDDGVEPTMSGVVDEQERQTYWHKRSAEQDEKKEDLPENEDDTRVVQTRARAGGAASSKPKAPLRIAGVLGAIASLHGLNYVLSSSLQVE